MRPPRYGSHQVPQWLADLIGGLLVAALAVGLLQELIARLR